MRRVVAARQSEAGVQIVTLPQLAARLAGGFVRPARASDLEFAVRTALKDGGFAELDGIRQLPGMTRAVVRTLAKAWDADVSWRVDAGTSARLGDLAIIEDRVRANLPLGVLTPRDLRDAALQRLAHAPGVLGTVELDCVVRVDPVWQSLLNALGRTVSVRWRNPGAANVAWFTGQVVTEARPVPADLQIVSCASPRAEVVEALRWVRELLASGRAQPEQIAVCATATDDWDEHMLVLTTDAGLPLHFSHGVSVLASREGQACAALADILLNGLSQDRVRRLISHAAGHSRALADLPQTWAVGLQRGAALFELDQWRRALDEAYRRRTDGVDVRAKLIPALECLAKGPDAAETAGDVLLGSAARALWTEALRRAPPQALEYSLQELRRPDGRDPGTCAVWCPAGDLAAAPRPWVRLLGMTTRSWPRSAGEDPLIPSHILARNVLHPDPITDRDRRAFVITANSRQLCALKSAQRARRSGGQPIVPLGVHTEVAKRSPQDIASAADHLLARPEEAAASSPARRQHHWHSCGPRSPAMMAHQPGHQSSSGQLISAVGNLMRLMLRDPLAFVWRYALGWRSLAEDDQPLTLDARTYGGGSRSCTRCRRSRT
jgi:hypothetical protein